MTKQIKIPQIRIIDGNNVVDRDMNSEELEIHNRLNEAEQQMLVRQQNRIIQMKSARAKLLQLGLTDQEINALLGL